MNWRPRRQPGWILARWSVALTLALLFTPAIPRAQERAHTQDAPTALEQLVREAVARVTERHARPLGQVVERRKGRVFVAVRDAPPAKGTRLEALRPLEGVGAGRERLITGLQVQRTTAGLLECREIDRVGREHAEAGDLVRLQSRPVRLLLAPCLALVDLAPVIPQVIGEKLRSTLLGRMRFELLDDVDAQLAAEAAYWSGEMSSFLKRQEKLDFVVVPVLMQTQNKLLLNLEYYSVERRRATDIDVATVELDDMLRAWLRAGSTRRPAPPGFRMLTSQTFPWRVRNLTATTDGRLFAVTTDSVHVLDFDYPGLRPRTRVFLGPREQVRQEAYSIFVHGSELREVLGPRAVEIASRAPVGDVVRQVLENDAEDEVTYVLSEERWPRVFASPQNGGRMPRSLAAVHARVGELFQEFWVSMRGPTRVGSRWWPAPGWGRAVVLPVFADVDSDGRTDLIWSNADGALLVQRVTSGQPDLFRGFGDVKAVQPAADAEHRAVLWLTDPVWDRQADRLHAAQLVEGKLRLVWSSEPFDATLVALASADLNSDGAHDLVAAEDVDGGSRMHVFMALPGEHTAARGGPWNATQGARP